MCIRDRDMTQRHIVKGSKHRRVYVVHSSHGNLLRLTPRRACYKLMSNQDVSPLRPDVHSLHRRPNRIAVGLNLRLRPDSPGISRFQEGQQVDGGLPVFVPEEHRIRFSAEHREMCIRDRLQSDH